jgi:hypothetical protein
VQPVSRVTPVDAELLKTQKALDDLLRAMGGEAKVRGPREAGEALCARRIEGHRARRVSERSTELQRELQEVRKDAQGK